MVQEVEDQYTEVFVEPKSLPPVRSLDHAIPLKPVAVLVSLRPNIYYYNHKNELEKLVIDMLTVGVIQPRRISKKSAEEWRQTQPTSKDSTMVQPSPADMTNMWTAVVGGPKKGRTHGTEVLQSSSSPSLFPSSSSTLQTMEEMKAMKNQIVELTQQCVANDAKFAKF
ncbi:hypothetical protein BC332_28397 [Capsicum chinense]|nr:hypothetical protein BC332_28397 [Capsicum chinense]